jgi:hypothetical protein
MGHNHTPARQPHPAEIVVALVLIVALLPVTLARRALARGHRVIANHRPR